MEDGYKIIIAHPGRHHSYRLASALKKGNNKIKYVTTIYNKKNSLIMKLMKIFISNTDKERVNNRINKDIKDKEVLQFYQVRGLIEILLSRIDKSKVIYSKWHKITSKRFGIKVAKYAIKNKYDVVICYDTNALECFKYLEEKSPNIIRIMDVAANNWNYMKQIYEKDMQICPQFENKLKSEVGFYLTEKNQRYIKDEIEKAEYLIVASNFVKKSYEFSNVKSNNIYICPYGVDLDKFIYNKKQIKQKNEAINFVFTGGTKQLKGIYYLLEAFLNIPSNLATLTIIGKCNLPENLLLKYKKRVSFIGMVMNDEIPNILNKMDIMIFPSLGDGFGLSVIEAMSCGCPIICTENSGVADLIQNGENGFIIPIQNIEEIIKKVEWFINNREYIPYMSQNARETAKQYTWDKYNIRINEIVRTICVENIKKGEKCE